MTVKSGSRLGVYEILGPLGAGGMGEVWRARDTRLQREIALKILPEAFASDADRLSRFTREAHVLASLNHPSIGAIYTFEQIDGVHLLGLELVPGETLKERIARGPVPVAEALGIARQIADGLEAAHGKGVLHRDLKPANVKVTPEGRVKLLDFGLAKAFASEDGSGELSQSPTAAADGTRQGLILGTASYMSPEQARGRPLDVRSDLWSLGCLVYEMLAGRKAFDGDTLSDILVAILDRDPSWDALPAATPPHVRGLLRGLLEKDLGRRLGDVRDVKAALEGTLEVPSTGRTFARSFARTARRRTLQWLVAGGAVVAALAVAFLLRTRPGDGALPKEKFLAILPFKDLSGRPEGQLLVDGLTESVAARLTKVQKIMVMTAGAPAAPDTELARFARDRGANLILQGAYRSQGDKVRLTFSLLATGSLAILAGDEVEGSTGDQFAVEDRLVESVLASLRVHGEGAGPAPADRPAEGEPYYKALGLLRRYDDPRSLVTAVDLLNGIAGGERSALVQAALGRAWIERYRSSKDPAAADAARGAVERAIALDDRSPEAHLAFGQLLTMTGQPKQAVVEIRRAIERRAPSADGLLALGDALLDAGDAAEAESAYNRAVALHTNYWAGYNRLGALYFSRGDLARGLQFFQQADEKNPGVPRVLSNMGAVLLRLGRLEEAEAAFRRAVALPPPDANAWSNLGTCEYLLGRPADAAVSFEKAVALAPFELRYRVHLGDAYTFAPGLADKAPASYEMALELAKTEGKVHALEAGTLSYVAKAEVRTGRPEQALATVAQAVQLDRNDRSVLFRAAVVYNILGRTGEALTLLGESVEKGLGRAQIAREPEFANLKDNPSFRKLITPVASAR